MARLIDAEPIIDECKECMSIEWNRNVYTTWAEAEEDFKNRLEDAPTVDAVPAVHGRWENGCCTACGFDIRDLIDADSDFRGWVWEGLPYCPNCGAKMDLEEKHD